MPMNLAGLRAKLKTWRERFRTTPFPHHHFVTVHFLDYLKRADPFRALTLPLSNSTIGKAHLDRLTARKRGGPFQNPPVHNMPPFDFPETEPDYVAMAYQIM